MLQNEISAGRKRGIFRMLDLIFPYFWELLSFSGTIHDSGKKPNNNLVILNNIGAIGDVPITPVSTSLLHSSQVKIFKPLKSSSF